MDSQPSYSGRFRSHSNNSNCHKDLLGRSSSSLSKSISDGSSQSLSSILNNPHDAASSSFLVGWVVVFFHPVTALEFAPLEAAAASKSELSRSDFQHYLDSISETHGRFEHIRNHSNKESTSFDDLEGADFALEDGAAFRAACPFSTMSENLVLQEKLSQYLDVVELHLVEEISLRSNSFFEAQGQLQDLNVKIVEGCTRIWELKETIRPLDADLVDSALRIHDLNATRSNLLALQQKLRLILYSLPSTFSS
ncbi:similar to VPS54 [Actinidia rufa]|uniref:Similar to VPS54 n=1 Tax=Actinidia rufa TaxID=165716 RepID=A0A7J0DM76_9ERIC|nr:similar to VPS54 [Actinidia rufa]